MFGIVNFDMSKWHICTEDNYIAITIEDNKSINCGRNFIPSKKFSSTIVLFLFFLFRGKYNKWCRVVDKLGIKIND